MLFSDRLEVWNPGALPPVPLEKLRQTHGSVPANPLLAEPMMAREAIELYIEGMLARGEEVPTKEGLLEYTLTVEAHA
ncbi:ATP-binding protein [Methanoculleus nereidis]|uniref:ATP-binding protein n=1 Tax=Methanoculleus nereidis TaxID=2735141 RepID=UPI002943E79E|nr:ATP-binding protein [Methanoculleus sp. YWC-01]